MDIRAFFGGGGGSESKKAKKKKKDDKKKAKKKKTKSSKRVIEILDDDDDDDGDDDDEEEEKEVVQPKNKKAKKEDIKPIAATDFFARAKPKELTKPAPVSDPIDEDLRLAMQLQREEEEAEAKRKEDEEAGRRAAQALAASERASGDANAKKKTTPKKRKIHDDDDDDDDESESEFEPSSSSDDDDDDFEMLESDEDDVEEKKKKKKETKSKPKRPKPVKAEAPAAKRAKVSTTPKAEKEEEEEEEEVVMQTKKKKRKRAKDVDDDDKPDSNKASAKQAAAGTPASDAKKKAAQNWHQRMASRGAPPKAGMKPEPRGTPDCLSGFTFVVTGVLESLERDAAETFIKRHGGRVTKAVSGKTSYLVAGDDPGESKIRKAEEKKTPVIDEDGLFALVTERSKASSSSSSSGGAEDSKKKAPAPKAKPVKPLKPSLSPQKERAEGHASPLWVDKYKPVAEKDLVGVAGPVKNLKAWLQKFPLEIAKANNKGFKRAALIAGPPGIGKTTTAVLVARMAGYHVIETNASDRRNKGLLKEFLGNISGNTNLTSFFKNKGGSESKAAAPTLPTCVVMDEVDGISGSQDRGGLPELVQVIKTTKVPIICICNDGGNQKMRTLKNHTLNVTFRRPNARAIATRLLQIAASEGLRLEPNAAERLAEVTNNDIRQCINLLQMWRANANALSFTDLERRMDSLAKDMTQNPFQVAPLFFRPPPTNNTKWLDDRINYYFVSSDLVPLFAQEMIYSARAPAPQRPMKSQADATAYQLECMAAAAESCSFGDVVSTAIWSNSDFSLMPLHAVMSAVKPGLHMCGGVRGQVMFPKWLGKNSTHQKRLRTLQALRVNTSREIRSDSVAFALDYAPALKWQLIKPLIDRGLDAIEPVMALLDEYGLTKDELTMLSEVGKEFNPSLDFAGVDSKTKAKLTREYNKTGHFLNVARDPSAFKASAAKVKGGKSAVAKYTGADDDDDDDDDGDDESSSSEDEDEVAAVKKTAMVTVKKVKKKTKTATKKKTKKKKKSKKEE